MYHGWKFMACSAACRSAAWHAVPCIALHSSARSTTTHHIYFALCSSARQKCTVQCMSAFLGVERLRSSRAPHPQ